MNSYLVVLRCNLDDLPILLTDDKGLALEVAQHLDPNCKAVKAVEDVLSLNASGEANVSIWTFLDGTLIASEHVKDFA